MIAKALPTRATRSYVIPSEVEGPPNCGKRHTSKRDPSTALRMTPLWLWRHAIRGQNVYRRSLRNNAEAFCKPSAT